MRVLGVIVLICFGGACLRAGELTLKIQAGTPVGPISPLHHGLMTEEINHCYDGGLYAELVQNRVFKDNDKQPVHWSVVKTDRAVASIALDGANPLNHDLNTSLRLDVAAVGANQCAGIANDGYWGIPVKPNTTYRASFYARASADIGPVTVAIEHEGGSRTYASATVQKLDSAWAQYKVTLKTGALEPTTKGRLTLTVAKPGAVWFTLVSLFPPTWNDRPNGLRPDLMQLLADMKPGFLRFPGGNYLEGNVLDARFPWKKTLGDLNKRPGHMGTWSYRSSDGMGLLEFLLWCEDLKMEPVLAVYAGYSLNKAPNNPIQPGPTLVPYVQEALEEIEYVIGGADTAWGARRAQDGHPAPFKLTYVEIGNEDFFDNSGTYDARFAQIRDAIKAKYPQLKCISSVGFEQPANKRVHSREPDVVDEHYYRSTAEFDRDSGSHYEKYPRNPPAIFVGEWAAHEDAKLRPWSPGAKALGPTPSLKAALGDAVWLAAMERNADLIPMQCYAPLFVNVNPGAWQWRPDLIGYDNLTAYGSPSYYVIKMFSTHLGDSLLKASLEGYTPQKGEPPPVHYSVTKNSKTSAVYIKIVNLKESAQELCLKIEGLDEIDGRSTAMTLRGQSLADTNSLQDPTKVVPISAPFQGVKPSFMYTCPAYSVTVLTVSGQ